MNPNDVILILERIAEMLTPGAQRAWEIAMKQAQVMGGLNHTWFIVGLVLAAIGVLVVICSSDSCDYGGGVLSGIMLVIIGGTVAGLCHAAYIQYSQNPEYQAIRILLGLVGR